MSNADVVASIKNRALATKGTAKAAQVAALGGKVKHGGPSILSRIVDVISRPLYATAEPVARVFEGKGAGDIAKGVVGGLAGKNKTDYGSVIERGAKYNSILNSLNKNKIAKTAVSLGANVLLDPTTYVGAGLIKSGGEQAAKTAGFRAIAEHLALPESVKAITEATDAAKLAKLEKATVAGHDAEKTARVVKQAGKDAARAANKELMTTAKDTVGKAAYEAAKTDAPGKVVLKFAGKHVAELEKPYAGLAKLGKIVGNTEVGGALSKAFRTAETFPETTNALRRKVQLAGLAHAEEDTKAMAKYFSDLTKDEKKMVTRAIEAGPTESAASHLHGVEAANGKDLGTYVDEAKRILGSHFDDEHDAGIFRHKDGRLKQIDESFTENYVPHYYQGGGKKLQELAKAGKKLAVGTEKPGFTQKRVIETLADAKAVGLDPIEEIDHILAKRTGAHYSSLARAKYSHGVAKEFGTDFGKTLTKKQAENLGVVNIPGSPYIHNNIYFPEKIADSIKAIDEMHTKNELYNTFLKHFDKVQNHWKFTATGVNPGHHFRNMIGDVWNNFAIGGVKNPDRYRQAAEVVLGNSDNFSMKVGEATLNRAQLLMHNLEAGAKPSFTAEEFGKDPTFLRGLKGKIASGSEKREEFTRMAHFIDAFKDEGKAIKANSPTLAKDLQEAADRAGARVRHANIDFGDITPFEKNVMKRAMPFYTWSRKNIPLQLEALAMHPGRIAAIPKGTAAIQTLMGTNQGGYNSLGVMDTIPKWLKQLSSVRLQGEGQGKNSIYWTPTLPFDDISKFTEGGTAGVFGNMLSMLSPVGKVPIELGTGKSVFTGAPRQTGAGYAAGQVPMLNQIYKMISGKQKVLSPQTLNYLAGAGVQEVTPGQVAGETYRQQSDLNKTLKALRTKAKKGK